MTTTLHEHKGRQKGFSGDREARIRRRVANRGAFPYLVGATAILAVTLGVLARLVASEDFHSYGDSMWWALVTLTTVGYGDIVPHTIQGRVVGGAVMLLGITFLSLLTATVTSLFIASDQEDRDVDNRERDAEVRTALQRIESRLAAIEDALARQR